MGMVVRTNTMATNAFRQLGNNNSAVSKSLEKLSSGFKINRAGDDASGLAISEKMKAQIKGLETASANAQDGISLIQTAEGALDEVHSMLNRMVELAGKSANGTLDSDVDREALQAELEALQDEIDRIATGTNFNGIKLLNGDLSAEGAEETPTVEQNMIKARGVEGRTGTAGAAARDANVKVEFTYSELKNAVNEKSKVEIAVGEGITVTASKNAQGKWEATASGTHVTGNKIAAEVSDFAVDNTTGKVTFTLKVEDDEATNASLGLANPVVKYDADITTGGQSATEAESTVTINLSEAAGDGENLTFKVGENTWTAAHTSGSWEVTGTGVDQYDISTDGSSSTKLQLVVTAKQPGEGDAPIADAAALGSIGGTAASKVQGEAVVVAEDGEAEVENENLEEVVISGAKADFNPAQPAQAQGGVEFEFKPAEDAAEAVKNANISLTLNTADTAVDAEVKVKLEEDTLTVTIGEDTYTADVSSYTGGDLTLTNGDGSESVVLSLAENGFTEGLKTALAEETKIGSVIATGKKEEVKPNLKVEVSAELKAEGIKGIKIYSENIEAGAEVKISYEVDEDDSDDVEGTITAKVGDRTYSGTWDGVKETVRLTFLRAGEEDYIDVEVDPELLGNSTGIDETVAGKTVDAEAKGGLKLQIGDTADSWNQLNVKIEDMSTEALGVGKWNEETQTGISIKTAEDAAKALAYIKDGIRDPETGAITTHSAINKVSTQRAQLGALQNRLEHTIKNLDVANENITAANSRIRDTDMAKEMMSYTQTNVLVQAAQAMLAQANQAPQSVLQLLQ